MSSPPLYLSFFPSPVSPKSSPNRDFPFLFAGESPANHCPPALCHNISTNRFPPRLGLRSRFSLRGLFFPFPRWEASPNLPFFFFPVRDSTSAPPLSPKLLSYLLMPLFIEFSPYPLLASPKIGLFPSRSFFPSEILSSLEAGAFCFASLPDWLWPFFPRRSLLRVYRLRVVML